MFRPMQRIRQQLSDDDCVKILNREKRGVLSVLGDDGYPYGLPINYWRCPDDGRIYFHGGLSGHKIDALANCDKASFCVCEQGEKREGEWWYRVRSIIIFGRVHMVLDESLAAEASRQLSLKFTTDLHYIEDEINRLITVTRCFCLVPEHMTGKIVTEK
ncbi:MAG: pyridoxamine 5'-phosphate oxidase family protein [Lachnospiraceae bacterium]|nr:pyridoxamine 5'-phosphate oxidase family protein [Lachnospiraceae bacterium]